VTTDPSTVVEFLDRWLVHIARGRSPTTIRDYRGKIKRIKERLGRIRLQADRSAPRPGVQGVARTKGSTPPPFTTCTLSSRRRSIKRSSGRWSRTRSPRAQFHRGCGPSRRQYRRLT
jgi:hypothetical protein